MGRSQAEVGEAEQLRTPAGVITWYPGPAVEGRIGAGLLAVSFFFYRNKTGGD